MSDRMEEQVLVIPTNVLVEAGLLQGMSSRVEHYLPRVLAAENLSFLPRSRAEDDPSFKQIIPYALISGQGKVLRYKRGKASGEKRLVAKASIGIGGHMNDQDEGLFALIGLLIWRASNERLMRRFEFQILGHTGLSV